MVTALGDMDGVDLPPIREKRREADEAAPDAPSGLEAGEIRGAVSIEAKTAAAEPAEPEPPSPFSLAELNACSGVDHTACKGGMDLMNQVYAFTVDASSVSDEAALRTSLVVPSGVELSIHRSSADGSPFFVVLAPDSKATKTAAKDYINSEAFSATAATFGTNKDRVTLLRKPKATPHSSQMRGAQADRVAVREADARHQLLGANHLIDQSGEGFQNYLDGIEGSSTTKKEGDPDGETQQTLQARRERDPSYLDQASAGLIGDMLRRGQSGASATTSRSPGVISSAPSGSIKPEVPTEFARDVETADLQAAARLAGLEGEYLSTHINLSALKPQDLEGNVVVVVNVFTPEIAKYCMARDKLDPDASRFQKLRDNDSLVARSVSLLVVKKPEAPGDEYSVASMYTGIAMGPAYWAGNMEDVCVGIEHANIPVVILTPCDQTDSAAADVVPVVENVKTPKQIRERGIPILEQAILGRRGAGPYLAERLLAAVPDEDLQNMPDLCLGGDSTFDTLAFQEDFLLKGDIVQVQGLRLCVIEFDESNEMNAAEFLESISSLQPQLLRKIQLVDGYLVISGSSTDAIQAILEQIYAIFSDSGLPDFGSTAHLFRDTVEYAPYKKNPDNVAAALAELLKDDATEPAKEVQSFHDVRAQSVPPLFHDLADHAMVRAILNDIPDQDLQGTSKLMWLPNIFINKFEDLDAGLADGSILTESTLRLLIIDVANQTKAQELMELIQDFPPQLLKRINCVDHYIAISGPSANAIQAILEMIVNDTPGAKELIVGDGGPTTKVYRYAPVEAAWDDSKRHTPYPANTARALNTMLDEDDGEEPTSGEPSNDTFAAFQTIRDVLTTPADLLGLMSPEDRTGVAGELTYNGMTGCVGDLGNILGGFTPFAKTGKLVGIEGARMLIFAWESGDGADAFWKEIDAKRNITSEKLMERIQRKGQLVVISAQSEHCLQAIIEELLDHVPGSIAQLEGSTAHRFCDSAASNELYCVDDAEVTKAFYQMEDPDDDATYAVRLRAPGKDAPDLF